MTKRRTSQAREEAERGVGAPASDRAGMAGPQRGSRAGAPDRGEAPSKEGWEGWDDYAPFYDWENARTLGRRDIPFWRTLALQSEGPVLELGCGTGRISIPLARAGVSIVGVDRSEAMLSRARKRIRRGRLPSRVQLIRSDIRALPFPSSTFPLVMAPYGVLQSLLRERDLVATLAAVARVLKPR